MKRIGTIVIVIVVGLGLLGGCWYLTTQHTPDQMQVSPFGIQELIKQGKTQQFLFSKEPLAKTFLVTVPEDNIPTPEAGKKAVVPSPWVISNPTNAVCFAVDPKTNYATGSFDCPSGQQVPPGTQFSVASATANPDFSLTRTR